MASICLVFKWLGCLVFKWHSKTRPFGIQPLFEHLNTRLVWYSDPHCTWYRAICYCITSYLVHQKKCLPTPGSYISFHPSGKGPNFCIIFSNRDTYSGSGSAWPEPHLLRQKTWKQNSNGFRVTFGDSGSSNAVNSIMIFFFKNQFNNFFTFDFFLIESWWNYCHVNNFTIISCFYTNSTSKTIILFWVDEQSI